MKTLTLLLSRSRYFSVLLLLCCGGLGPGPDSFPASLLADPTEKAIPLPGGLELGMTPEQVRGKMGPPTRIARQVLYQRHLEQWVYEKPQAVRLYFEATRGQLPRLVKPPDPTPVP
jgi:hypothetical protein